MLVRIIDAYEESIDSPLEAFYSIKITLKNASKVIKQLNETFPWESSKHLKRIRKIYGEDSVTALVCRCSDKDEEGIKSKLLTNSIPFESMLTVNAPVRLPLTKKQYKAWNSVWPLVFHESMDEKLKLKQHGEHSALLRQFEPVFLENEKSLLIAESVLTNNGYEYIKTLIVYESGPASILCDHSEQSYPFDHVIINALTSTACMKNKRITRNGKIPYLLSGCIAILSHEPCTMCSMALLHSRIDAVIFYNSNKCSGALGSNCHLHSMDSLNHRFPVYKIAKNLDSLQ